MFSEIYCAFLFSFLLFSLPVLNGQITSKEDTSIEDLLENVAEVSEAEEMVAYSTSYEKVRLNDCTVEELLKATDLRASLCLEIINHILVFGRISDWEEMGMIEGMEEITVSKLKLTCTIEEVPSVVKALQGIQAQTVIQLQWKRIFPKSHGYLNAFNGDPNRLILKCKGELNRIISYGFIFEKDAGEKLLQKNTPFPLPDFSSFHIRLKKPLSMIDEVIIGDFSILLGQGLIHHQGFGATKSLYSRNLLRYNGFTKPYSSLLESGLQRGLAVRSEISKKLTFSFLLSSIMRDAKLYFNSKDSVFSAVYFQSISKTGLHRTDSETLNKGTIRESLIGTKTSFRFRRGILSFQNLWYFYSKKQKMENIRVDLLFKPFSNRYQINSIAWNFSLRNTLLFGEAAISGTGSTSILTGLMSSFGKYSSVTTVLRYFSKAFYSPGASSFGEINSVSNEIGAFIKVDFRLFDNVTFSSFADIWKHPWLRYGLNSPSYGRENHVKLVWEKRKHASAYILYKNKVQSHHRADIGFDRRTSTAIRIHFIQKISTDLEFRMRLEWKYIKTGDDKSKGNLYYGELVYQPLGSTFSIKVRSCLFDTEDHTSRIYAYEFNLIGSYSVPSYSGEGIRYILYARFQPISNMKIEFRYALVRYFNVDRLKFGLDEIEGPAIFDFSIQATYRIGGRYKVNNPFEGQ